MADVATVDGAKAGPMTGEQKKVIFASSLGTIFEWYDFYLYGSLAVYIGATFFSQYPETTRNIFALLAFAAGFLVRPFGALVFGRLGDLVGRKYTFLVTIVIMGLSTFLVGILPGAASIGIAAPILLIALRMLQGLALGGEYGGAATYVAEHAPQGKRGYFTSWIQTTATLGLFLSLVVIVTGPDRCSARKPSPPGAGAFRSCFPVILLGVSVWIRLKMNESPAFKKMKEEGKGSKAPLTEAFGQWRNAKIALLALFGAVVGQAVVWYSGQFYALFFLQNILKVDGQSAKHHGRGIAAPRHRLLRLLRLAVGQDRPQADHHGRPAARHGHLLPAVQGADLGRQSGAGRSTGNHPGNRHRRSGRLQIPVQPDRHGEVHDILRYRDLVPDAQLGSL